MNSDPTLNRRRWLRSLSLATGATGLIAAQGNLASAAQSGASTDPGIFNVLIYGAIGDGRSDDSIALQNAILAAENFAQGGIVFLPTGSYRVTRSLLITGRVKILGQGQSTLDGATHIIAASLDFDVIKAMDVNCGIVLEGFTIRGDSNLGTGGHFLRFQGCQHVRVNGVDLSNFWNGMLVDGSGDVVVSDMSLDPCDVPGKSRFGLKCTAVSGGNPNATTAFNCDVVQSGDHTGTVDAFVLANGYNSLTAINCGALNCNRAFWSTKDGGEPPNFLVVSLGTSDHCKTAVQLDDGSYNQFSDLLVTSSYVNSINVGVGIAGPVAFSNCIITDAGDPPYGTGYHIFSTQSPNVTITGGSIQNTGGNAVEISGNANVIIAGVAISAIQDAEGEHGADGINLSGGANVTLSAVSLAQIKNTAIRIVTKFTGLLTFSALLQQTAKRGLYDEGSSGKIVGSGTFQANSVADMDVSRNRNPQTCIQGLGSIPFPADPTPAVPASGKQVHNIFGTPCMVYLSGRNVQRVTVNGVNIGVQTSIYLPVDRTISIDYTDSLSWVWQRVA
jgi:hypothetical protein